MSAYADAPRAFLLAYKEDNRFALQGLLGEAVARAVLVAVGSSGPVRLVPVPSTAAARRQRGDDVVARLARRAAAAVRRHGLDCATVAALRHRHAVRDSAGLGATDRALNLADAFQVAPRAVAHLGGRPVVLVDDLVTTGATLAECARTLRSAGVVVVAAATVAATRRREPRAHQQAQSR